ncbi:MAG: SDR family oxidoreductase [Gluconobacter potus]|uniref:SDR family oxidoreductase n=1 Tax=Gluconobacter potus TaxID=2724927 RepID=A0ABR9YI42_9PROT|nr:MULTISPECIES: SDR family oxidoreductase [Gluconobacter]MBF0863568.1 SDR family oxidoreductase [Gluconobacter sp. R71656]MBF0866375.1 SDR family oxidoreductase [Gluconobacter sp. R75628]MBF0872497.1 SDR family oxidoreductase [Gluconobacter sp. R75629]MBF0881463.1 SDR family oxidoreductase [Gluconobacter potus]
MVAPFRISPRVPRVALVTGSARRIGAALVEMLAEQGFAVAIHCRDSTNDAEALLERIGGKGCVLQADLQCEEDVEALLPRASAALGPVGILINNASAFIRDEMGSVTRESWDLHLETNLRAPFVLSQAMAQALPEGAEGLILNMLDQRVWNLTPHFVSYTLSRTGLWTLTQTMALALAPRVRVNAIGPGPVLPAVRQSQEHFDNMCARTPLQHGSSPEEIAQAALALFALPSVTGQMLALDGGQHLNWSPAS